MTSMLEKACAAVYALAPIGVRTWQDCPVAEAEAIRAGVRAVLAAIRELDEPALKVAGFWWYATLHNSKGQDENGSIIFMSVIDAILAGEESKG